MVSSVNGSSVMGRLWVLVFCLLLVAPSIVLSHASLVKSVPARRAQLFKSPAQIQLWFNERLEARYSSLRVIDSSGKRVDLGNVVTANATALLVIQRMDPIYADFTVPEHDLSAVLLDPLWAKGRKIGKLLTNRAIGCRLRPYLGRPQCRIS